MTQTEPDKVTTKVTRFASSRCYMQRLIYILRGSFEGEQVAERQCLSLALLKVFSVCLICVFQFFKSDFYIQTFSDVLNTGPLVVLMIRPLS